MTASARFATLTKVNSSGSVRDDGNEYHVESRDDSIVGVDDEGLERVDVELTEVE